LSPAHLSPCHRCYHCHHCHHCHCHRCQTDATMYYLSPPLPPLSQRWPRCCTRCDTAALRWTLRFFQRNFWCAKSGTVVQSTQNFMRNRPVQFSEP
jgi:hypothetical protein